MLRALKALLQIEVIVGLTVNWLTHWGRVTHKCVSKLNIIGSDNGLSPGRRQAIIRTNAGILLIRPLGTNFSEFLVEILIFSFKKMRLKVSSAKRRPFCLGLNELIELRNRKHTINPSPPIAAYTRSETYFRQDLFPSYSFFRRQFHAIVIFRLKSISDLDSGSLPRFFGEFT